MVNLFKVPTISNNLESNYIERFDSLFNAMLNVIHFAIYYTNSSFLIRVKKIVQTTLVPRL
jgi:hypothetical protein